MSKRPTQYYTEAQRKKDIQWVNNLSIFERADLIKNNQGQAINLKKFRRDCIKYAELYKSSRWRFYLTDDRRRLFEELGLDLGMVSTR